MNVIVTIKNDVSYKMDGYQKIVWHKQECD
jgi:hypothetical protein